MERHPFITSKGEELTRRGRHVRHAISDSRSNKDARHSSRATPGTSGVVEDLDERIASRTLKDALKVAQCVAESDKHNKAKCTIGNGCPDHDSWQRL